MFIRVGHYLYKLRYGYKIDGSITFYLSDYGCNTKLFPPDKSILVLYSLSAKTIQLPYLTDFFYITMTLLN